MGTRIRTSVVIGGSIELGMVALISLLTRAQAVETQIPFSMLPLTSYVSTIFYSILSCRCMQALYPRAGLF